MCSIVWVSSPHSHTKSEAIPLMKVYFGASDFAFGSVEATPVLSTEVGSMMSLVATLAWCRLCLHFRVNRSFFQTRAISESCALNGKTRGECNWDWALDDNHVIRNSCLFQLISNLISILFYHFAFTSKHLSLMKSKRWQK